MATVFSVKVTLTLFFACPSGAFSRTPFTVQWVKEYPPVDKLGVIVLTTSFRFLVALVEVNKPAGSDFCSKVTCAHALMGNTNKHSKEEGNEPNKPEKNFFLAWLFIMRSASYNYSVIQ